MLKEYQKKDLLALLRVQEMAVQAHAPGAVMEWIDHYGDYIAKCMLAGN